MSRPCLILGLGGIGVQAMIACREIYRQIPASERIPAGFLGIDFRDECYDGEQDDLVFLSTTELREVLTHLDCVIDGELAWADVHDWFPDRDYFAHIPIRPSGTGKARPLGRLALWTTKPSGRIRSALWRRLGDLCNQATFRDDRNTDIVIIASAWGGTGSALALDLARLTQRLVGVGQQDLILALPQLHPSGADDRMSFQNTFATLVEVALAQRSAAGSEANPEIDIEPFVAMRPIGHGDTAVKTLAETVTARLRRPLACAVNRWRRRALRVRFLPRPVPRSNRFHAAVGTSIPLVSLAKLPGNLDSVLDEEMAAITASRSTAEEEESGNASGIGRTIENFASSLDGLLDSWEIDIGARLESLTSISDQTDQPLPSLRILEPLLSPPQQVSEPAEFEALLASLGDTEFYSQLEEVAMHVAEELSVYPADEAARRIAEEEERFRELLPDSSTTEDGRSEWQLHREEMEHLESRLNRIPAWRRIPLPRRLRRRNNQVWSNLLQQSIERLAWQESLTPLAGIVACQLIGNQLLTSETQPNNRDPRPETPPEKPSIEHDALRHLAQRYVAADQNSDPDMETERAVTLATEIRSRKRQAGRILLPAPRTRSLKAALSDCRTDAFVGRISAEQSSILVALIPKGLFWPEGDDALEAEIRRYSQGVPVEMIRSETSRIIFYLEERDQPFHNLEQLSQYRLAYDKHPYPVTLHTDRQIVDSEDYRDLVDGCQSDDKVDKARAASDSNAKGQKSRPRKSANADND